VHREALHLSRLRVARDHLRKRHIVNATRAANVAAVMA
jgi:hypothetical protein